MFIKILLFIIKKLNFIINGNNKTIYNEQKVKISTSNNKLNIIPNNNDLLDLELSESPKLKKSPTKLNFINENNNLIEINIVKDNNGDSYKIIWNKFCEDYGFFEKCKV